MYIMDQDFKFSMLTKRQLLKLASSYNLKIQGAMPNNTTTIEELLELVEKNLKVLEDGAIVKKDESKSFNEVKVSGSGVGVRITII